MNNKTAGYGRYFSPMQILHLPSRAQPRSPKVAHQYARFACGYSPKEIYCGSLYLLAEYLEICHTPVLQKLSHLFALRNIPVACASFSKRNVAIADACRPKSAGAPLKQHKVEQVPPCIYRAELVGDLASPNPSFFRLLKDKKQPACGLFSASKPWQTS